MRFYIIILALFFSQSSLSSIWPSASAPCNTTLDACAEATAEGSFVEVRSNTVDETVTVTKSVSLIAGNGYRPVFTAGNGIDLTAASLSNYSLTIKGFTITRGRISVNHLGSGDLDLTISDNRFLANSSAAKSIRILQRGSGTLNISVDYNTINHDFFTPGIEVDSGTITVINNLNDGDVTGRIYGNTIHVVGTNGSTVGIGIYNQQPGTIDLNITGNEIHTTHTGIRANSFPPADAMDLDISSNAIYTAQNSMRMVGLGIYANFTTIKFDAVNNSIIGANEGISVFDNGDGSIDGQIFNNIIAYGPSTNVSVYTDVPAMTNDYNLFYATGAPIGDFVPGPNHLTSEPMIKGLQNARLKVGSPAIDEASSIQFLLVADAPFVDADGTARFKKLGFGAATPDIGAYESGDVAFNHVAQTASHISNLDDANLNGDDSLDDLHVTSNWNPDGAAGVYNNSNEAMYYASGLWRVFNQDFVNIPDGATFNIFKNSAKNSTFEHTATGASSSSRISRSGMDDDNTRIVQLSQHWTGIYNDNPVGIYYVAGDWYVNNANNADIPAGSNFNVTYQEPSKSAYKHTTNSVNSIGNSTVLDHPLLNGNNCAQIQVTQDASLFGAVNSPLGVWYNGSKWLIFNQNLTTMPANVIFHINISPEQASVCDFIFISGFDL